MTEQDRSYYKTRAEQELQRARNAEHPQASQAHHRLADIYLARAEGWWPERPAAE